MYTCLYFSCSVQCFFPYIDVCISFDAHEMMVSPKKIPSLKLAAKGTKIDAFPMGNHLFQVDVRGDMDRLSCAV